MSRSNGAPRAIFAVALILSLASPAQAYIGPGAGLTAIGAFIAFVAAVVVALVAFVWYPIRRMMRKARAKPDIHGDPADDDA